jgi:hypothetical protein
VAGGLEPVDADGVAADLLRLQGVAYRGALVNDLDAGRFDLRHVGFRVAAGGLDEADPLLGADIDVGRVVRRPQRREKGEVDTEGFVGHVPAFTDLRPQASGVREGEGGHEAHAAGVRHRRDQFGGSHPHEAALDDGPFDAEEFGDACL